MHKLTTFLSPCDLILQKLFSLLPVDRFAMRALNMPPTISVEIAWCATVFTHFKRSSFGTLNQLSDLFIPCYGSKFNHSGYWCFTFFQCRAIEVETQATEFLFNLPHDRPVFIGGSGDEQDLLYIETQLVDEIVPAITAFNSKGTKR